MFTHQCYYFCLISFNTLQFFFRCYTLIQYALFFVNVYFGFFFHLFFFNSKVYFKSYPIKMCTVKLFYSWPKNLSRYEIRYIQKKTGMKKVHCDRKTFKPSMSMISALSLFLNKYTTTPVAIKKLKGLKRIGLFFTRLFCMSFFYCGEAKITTQSVKSVFYIFILRETFLIHYMIDFPK